MRKMLFTGVSVSRLSFSLGKGKVGLIRLGLALEICSPSGYQSYQPDIKDIINGYHEKIDRILINIGRISTDH